MQRKAITFRPLRKTLIKKRFRKVNQAAPRHYSQNHLEAG